MEKERKRRVTLGFSVVVILFCLIIFISNPALMGFAIYEGEISTPSEGEDTYIRNNSESSFGTDSVLKVGKTAAGMEYRSFLEFNLSSISESTVISSKVQFYVSTINTPSLEILAYQVITSWDENSMTWANASTSNPWILVGGDYSTLLDSINITSTGWYNLSILSATRNWINGSSPNYGIIIIPSSSTGSNNLTEIASSNNADPSLKPSIIIDYTANAQPIITEFYTNSNLSSIKKPGEIVTFSVSWNDLENNPSQLFVCNSSSIIFPTGCADKTFCNTSLSQTNPVTCNYTLLSSDNRTTPYFISMCDSVNCSAINESQFYINHLPIPKIVQPNGGETINQSLGNYHVKFNVTDADNDSLTAILYYGESQNSKAYSVVSNLNLTSACNIRGDLTIQKNCSYSWNTTGLYGTYYLTMDVNDSFHVNSTSSSSSFNIVSLIDSTPPNITAQWIENARIYSGRPTQVYSNISETNIKAVWFSINDTYQNISMSNTTLETYNGTFFAPSPGNYQFKVYANDTVGNLNNSMPWVSFTVEKPNATAQSINSPSTALPYSTVRVSSQLNSSEPLRDVYAYLNIPEGFTFISGYTQNTAVGNFTSNETKTTNWILTSPLSQGNYTLNVTYTDLYSNNWNTSNSYSYVSSSVSGNNILLSLSSYPEVQASENYYAEATISSNNVNTNPDSITISLYDPTGNLIVGPVSMSQKQTGIYNYTYAVPSTQTVGIWETRINATLNSVSYYTNAFWNLVGALFDIRNIQVVDAHINKLNISVEAENVGNNPTDLTLVWNLTRTDTNALLGTGAETFAVGATPVTKYIAPSTSYIGEVKITFIGFYGTEKAGAFEIFSTLAATSNETTPETPSTGGGGGGGGATATQEKKARFNITYEKEISVAKNLKKTILVKIKNSGEIELTNVTLFVLGIPEDYYEIPANAIEKIKIGEENSISVEFLITDFIGEQEFQYVVSSNEIIEKLPVKIVSMNIKDYFIKEIARLSTLYDNLMRIADTSEMNKSIEKCNLFIVQAKSNFEKEEYIDTRINLEKAQICFDNIKISESKFKLPKISSAALLQILGIVLIITIILALIFIVYLIYKKLSILEFMKKEEKTLPSSKEAKRKLFEDKIKHIEEELEK